MSIDKNNIIVGAIMGIMMFFVTSSSAFAIADISITSMMEIFFTPTVDNTTTTYAIQVDDRTENTTQYLQENHQLGSELVWQDYATWIGNNDYIQILNLHLAHDYRVIVIARTQGEPDGDVFTDVSFQITQRPKRPRGLTVIAKSATTLTIGWVKREQATTYRLQVRERNEWKRKNWRIYKGISHTTKTIDELTEGMSYVVRLRACNKIGCSAYTKWKPL